MTATADVQRVKLEDPGSSLEIAVEYVSPEKLGEFEYWLIGGAGVETLVPKKSLDPQLDRVGVATAPELLGHVIRLSRSEKVNKYNKPYWNLDGVALRSASKMASVPPKPSVSKTQLPQARSLGTPDFLPTEGEEQAELQSRIGADLTRAEAITAKQRVYSAAMKQAVAYVLKEIEPLYTQSNIGLTGDEAYKHAYSIYATWCDKGLVE